MTGSSCPRCRGALDAQRVCAPCADPSRRDGESRPFPTGRWFETGRGRGKHRAQIPTLREVIPRARRAPERWGEACYAKSCAAEVPHFVDRDRVERFVVDALRAREARLERERIVEEADRAAREERRRKYHGISDARARAMERARRAAEIEAEEARVAEERCAAEERRQCAARDERRRKRVREMERATCAAEVSAEQERELARRERMVSLDVFSPALMEQRLLARPRDAEIVDDLLDGIVLRVSREEFLELWHLRDELCGAAGERERRLAWQRLEGEAVEWLYTVAFVIVPIEVVPDDYDGPRYIRVGEWLT